MIVIFPNPLMISGYLHRPSSSKHNFISSSCRIQRVVENMPNSFLNLLIFYADTYKYIQNVIFFKSKFMKTFIKLMIRMCTTACIQVNILLLFISICTHANAALKTIQAVLKIDKPSKLDVY